jgi:hypothetical protein
LLLNQVEITVFAGGKVGIDVTGVGASARAGFYTKIDAQTGAFTDAGFKTSLSGCVGLECGVERTGDGGSASSRVSVVDLSETRRGDGIVCRHLVVQLKLTIPDGQPGELRCGEV